MREERKLITVTEAAELLGVVPQRVRQLLSAGLLTGERVNSRLWLVDLKSVKERLENPIPPGRPKGS